MIILFFFILCKEKTIEEKLKRLIDHGRLDKFDHEIIGYNQRIDAMQAAILSVKMKYIYQWTKRRQEIARYYDNRLKSKKFKVIECSSNKESVYHVYCVEVENRDHIRDELSKLNIQTGIHLIFGLPGEDKIEMIETAKIISGSFC